MFSSAKKTLLAALSLTLLSGYLTPALADDPPAQTPTSNAMAFAIQAGSIAGATQACGQDISVFVNRVGEALNKLSINPQDRVYAMSSFQKAMEHSQQVQKNNFPIPCNQVMQDYNSLPIMRPDYQQTVIAQLNPAMSGNAPPPPNSDVHNQTNAAGTMNQQNMNGIPNAAPPVTQPAPPYVPQQGAAGQAVTQPAPKYVPQLPAPAYNSSPNAQYNPASPPSTAQQYVPNQNIPQQPQQLQQPSNQPAPTLNTQPFGNPQTPPQYNNQPPPNSTQQYNSPTPPQSYNSAAPSNSVANSGY